MTASEPAGRTLLLVRRLGAAAALIILGAAVASAVDGSAAVAGTAAGGTAAGGTAAGGTAPAPAAGAPAAVPAGPEASGPRPPPARASPCDRGSPGEPINLNQASSEELQRLPGIGPARAASIVEHRRRHGPFKRLRDLRRVKGIGARTLQRLAPMLALDPPASSLPARNVPHGR